ncbi:hypothetical protein GCM10009066_13240 [Halarchaeum salinum]|uniref:Uncharacterized protein n=2 Tax=Halarchaeum salinum TaxID=489912 RepID=A0AAV3S7H8_9EURY
MNLLPTAERTNPTPLLPICIMATDADGLREVFETIADTDEVVEEQREAINHGAGVDDENDAIAHAIDDGLNGAIEGQEAGGGASFE